MRHHLNTISYAALGLTDITSDIITMRLVRFTTIKSYVSPFALIAHYAVISLCMSDHMALRESDAGVKSMSIKNFQVY